MTAYAKIAPVYAMPRRRSFCGACLLDNVCAKAVARVPSLVTVRKPETRLAWQNYLVRLKMPSRVLIDFEVHALRDFVGRFVDEEGSYVPTPGIACILTPGAEFWMRDQIEHGAWSCVADVPKLRSEATSRWRLIGTTIAIVETIQPACDTR